MSYFSQTIADLKIIKALLLNRPKGENQKERMDNFYNSQAEYYDSFRKRLLPGRQELIQQIFMNELSGHWLDLGAGTGSNLDLAENFLPIFKKVTLLDICKPLLIKADEKIINKRSSHVSTLCCDIMDFNGDPGQFDLITMSYSLTMMPEWYKTIEKVQKLLKRGGIFGIVDFYLGDNSDIFTLKQHKLYRLFWKKWFAFDGVYLNPMHIKLLSQKFDVLYMKQDQSKICYVPFLKAPYYICVCKNK